MADFIGESNFIAGRVAATEGDKTLVQTEAGLNVWVPRLDGPETDTEVSVAVRPEKIEVLSGEAAEGNEYFNRFEGRIEEVVYVGEARIYRVGLAPEVSVNVKVQSGPNALPHKVGDTLTIGWRTSHGLALQ